MICCIYAQRLVRYKIFVWRPQLILWPLVRQLRFVINDRNKCIMSSLDEWRPSYNDDHKFLIHQLPPCLLSRLLDKIRTNSSNASYSMCCAFMTIWYLGGWVPCVRPGCVQRANMSRFSHVSFGNLLCAFPSSFNSFVFFLIHFFVLGFVYVNFLSLFCIPW